jgi:hypothetical protein
VFGVQKPSERVLVSKTLRHDRLDELTGSAGIYQSPGWLRFSASMCPGPTRYAMNRFGVAAAFMSPAKYAGRCDMALTLDEEGTAEFELGDDAQYAMYLGRTWPCADLSLLPDAPLSTAPDLFSALSNVVLGFGADVGTLPFLPREAAERLVAADVVDPDEIILQDVAAVIDLQELGTFPDGLPASRRSSVRRDIRKFEKSGLRIEEGKISAALDYAAPMNAAVELQHGHTTSLRVYERAMEKQAKYLDDESVVFTVLDAEDRAVAYSLSFVWGTTLHVRLVGLDYERAESTGAYFHVTYTEPVLWAQERGLRFVDVGILALRPKVLRGGSLHPRFAVFRRADGRRLSRRAVEAASQRTLARVAEDVGPLATVDSSLLFSV